MGRIRHRSIVAAVAVILLTAGCGKGGAAVPSDAPSADASTLSVTPNDIDKSAAAAYRAALVTSLAAAKSDGMTELWSEGGSEISTVLVWDAKAAKGAQHDIASGDVEPIDFESMLPQANIDELDGLEANTGFDIGSVKSKDGTFIITTKVDDSSMVTTYTLDAQGRIGSATATLDGESAGSATFVYGVAPEGATALAKLK